MHTKDNDTNCELDSNASGDKNILDDIANIASISQVKTLLLPAVCLTTQENQKTPNIHQNSWEEDAPPKIRDTSGVLFIQTKLFGKITKYILDKYIDASTSMAMVSRNIGFTSTVSGTFCKKVKAMVPDVYERLEENKKKVEMGLILPVVEPLGVVSSTKKKNGKDDKKNRVNIPKKTVSMVLAQDQKVKFSCLEYGDRFWLDELVKTQENLCSQDKYGMKIGPTEVWVFGKEQFCCKKFHVPSNMFVRPIVMGEASLQDVLRRYCPEMYLDNTHTDVEFEDSVAMDKIAVESNDEGEMQVG